MRRPFPRFYSLLSIAACFFLFIPHTIRAKAEVIQKMKGHQVHFMANGGQMDERVSFYASTFGGTVFITRDGEIIYSLPKIEEKEKNHPARVLKEELVGVTLKEIADEEKSPTKRLGTGVFPRQARTKQSTGVTTFHEFIEINFTA